MTKREIGAYILMIASTVFAFFKIHECAVVWTIGVALLCSGCIGNPHVVLPCDDTLSNCGKSMPLQSLALPPESGIDRFEKLQSFLSKFAPEYQFYITEKGRPETKGWRYTGFVWEGYRIFARKSLASA